MKRLVEVADMNIYDTFLYGLAHKIREELNEIIKKPDFYNDERFKVIFDAYNTYQYECHADNDVIFNLNNNEEFITLCNNGEIGFNFFKDNSKALQSNPIGFAWFNAEGKLEMVTSAKALINKIMEFGHRMCAYILSHPQACPNFFKLYFSDYCECSDFD